MDNLTVRARELESKLNNCGATLVEVSLATVREAFECSPDEISGGALTGAVALATVVLEQLERSVEPYSRDGDIQVGFASYSPGRSVDAYVAKVRATERAAVLERRRLLAPLVEVVKVAAGLGDAQ